MDNMRIYNAGREVPANAIKKITGGSYGAAGLSDINPQWRIEKLTETFGPCGDGWYMEPQNVWVEGGTMYAHIHVFYKTESGEWSRPINGWGGTRLSGKDDADAVKSTITDAFSNACRYLGIGADVWLKQFDTKYSAPPPASAQKQEPKPAPPSSGPTPQQANPEPRTSASKLSGLATPFQVKTIMETAPTDVIEAMKQTYGGVGFPKLTFARAKEAIDKLKGGK